MQTYALLQTIPILLSFSLILHCNNKELSESESRFKKVKIFHSEKLTDENHKSLPLEIGWSIDKDIRINEPVEIQVAVKALTNLNNVIIQLKPGANLKFAEGPNLKVFSSLKKGETEGFLVKLLSTEIALYDLIVYVSANESSNPNERIISIKTIEFQESSLKNQTTQNVVPVP